MELHDIDGTIAALFSPRGFRKYVQQMTESISMTGELMGIPRVNANVNVVGTQLQHEKFAEFMSAPTHPLYIIWGWGCSGLGTQ